RWSDELREQGLRYARDMTHRGREFVEDAFGDNDPRFSSPDPRGGDQRPGAAGQGPGPGSAGQRPGPSGRYQNH
ncbi:MAG: hypothetical protein AVDCRST_MAG90-58, partial [uncultured Microvirga sp.]